MNRMRNICNSIIVLLLRRCLELSKTQAQKVDSLKQVLNTNIPDTVRVQVLNALAQEYLSANAYDETFETVGEAVRLSEEINYLPGKALAFKNRGMGYFYQGNYIETLQAWEESLKTYEAIPDTLGISNILNNIGVVYYYGGATAKALEYYLRSLTVAEGENDPLRIATALNNIGGLYGEMGDYDKAYEYYHQAEPYLALIDDVQQQTINLMGLGEIAYKNGDYAGGISKFEEALTLIEDQADYSYCLIMMARIKKAQGDTNGGIEDLTRALTITQEYNFQSDEVGALILLGEFYMNSDPSRAISIFQEAESKAKELGFGIELRDTYKLLSKTYAGISDFSNAYAYQGLYVEMKDSIFNVETDDKIRGLQFDFDLLKKQDEITLLQSNAEISELQQKRQRAITWGVGVSSVIMLLLVIGVFNRYKYIKKTNRIIEAQTARSENLLLNILPEETARELKEKGRVAAKKYEQVSVMFTDFKGFTEFSKNLTPEELVKSIDFFFSKFDEVVESYNLEKIKTIGDAYMCAGGLPDVDPGHPKRLLLAAFDILEIVEDAKHNPDHAEVISFDIRIGINTGPVVAGVVGYKKFAYDIWGDTVNVASRSEGLSEPGRINITENTYELVKDDFECEYRGEIFVKNKGMVKMYFVLGPKEGVKKAAMKNLKLGQEST